MKTSEEEFVLDVIAAIHPLKAVLSEHLSDNDELLPHVLMGSITRHAVLWQEAATNGSREADAWVGLLLDRLERGEETGDQPVGELIAASFLENLDLDVPAASALALRFGPRLSDRLRSMQ